MRKPQAFEGWSAMQQRDVEVLVVGGGPAGSTIAHRLARLGHDVLLLEQSPFPRRRIGESLTPGIDPILEALELRESVARAGFLRPSHAHVRWSAEAEPPAEGMARPGYQVERGQFDQLLLQAACDAGVRVLQPARALAIRHVSPQRWQVRVDTPDGRRQLSARFLVDATGKGGLLQPRLRRVGAPTLALYAYWRPVAGVGAESRVEAGESHWCWGAPLPDGSFNAAVFLSPGNPLLKARAPLEQAYAALLSASPLLSACLGERISPVHGCNAGAYIDDDPVGEDFIKVGDAAFSIDPLSSQGVQAAMMSALQGSVVAHTLLTDANRQQDALQFYRARQQDTVRRHAQWAAAAYAERAAQTHTGFWRERAQPGAAWRTHAGPEPASPAAIDRDAAIRISPQASWVEVPALVGADVRPTAALCHPALAAPVAFVSGVALFPVLALVGPADTLGALEQKLQRVLPGAPGQKLLQWLLEHRIVVEQRSVAA